jgi:hypothetical protein
MIINYSSLVYRSAPHLIPAQLQFVFVADVEIIVFNSMDGVDK